MEDIKWLDVKMSAECKEHLEYQEFLRKQMFTILGIPSYLIKEPNETLWQKIKRNVRSLIYKIGLKRNKSKKDNRYYPESLSAAIYWTRIEKEIKKFHHELQRKI